MEHKITDAEFEEDLKSFPCPSCQQIGYLKPHSMQILAEYKGGKLSAEGDGTICEACGTKTISIEMTESLVNQKKRIDGDVTTYLEVNSAAEGGFITHLLN